ncbi:hypothetical protein [Salipiger aestuarii]|uniref:hypothetical protein n=1 Tax=Salipiger aestuarii TaxID=568098 RepID=UPI00025B4C0C|nr:hypothetical protein [Salipiger aestuarii]EIE49999.1 hypothetical protein C357_15766 [Citreicella sp. 357]KAA8611467.1 hypothetical protein AL037_09100 [Salipiger aestuarii]
MAQTDMAQTDMAKTVRNPEGDTDFNRRADKTPAPFNGQLQGECMKFVRLRAPFPIALTVDGATWRAAVAGGVSCGVVCRRHRHEQPAQGKARGRQDQSHLNRRSATADTTAGTAATRRADPAGRIDVV